MSRCPDAYASEVSQEPEEVHITLFESSSHDLSDGKMKDFVGETLSSAVLDTGCTKTVCGRNWLNYYLDTSDEVEKQSVQIHPSNTVFKFGDGHEVVSLERHRIPAFIGNKKLFIETNVVDSEIPLLLSKAAMKKAGSKLDFCHDTVTMLGENVKLSFTESGHYCIPTPNKKQLISQNGKDQVKIVLHVSDLSSKGTEEKRKMILKLHQQI